MGHHGFVRVAAATPTLRVADCDHNADRITALMKRAQDDSVSILVFPELSLTGYTCADLFQQLPLQRGALAALERVVEASRSVYSGFIAVGLPLVVDSRLFNVAVAFCGGAILGVVPKSYLPNYKEFYERRWFAPASHAQSCEVRVCGQTVPFGTDMLFAAEDADSLVVGMEICEDLWVPIPPSCHQALRGATVLLNLSAGNETIGKVSYRRQLVANQSGRCIAGYVYAACGVTESTTDLVFGGHAMIAENGVMMAEAERFEREDELLVADLDVERVVGDRIRTTSFSDNAREERDAREFRKAPFRLGRPAAAPPLKRQIDAHPFVPQGTELLRERCEEIFHTQVAGLAKRLEHIGKPPTAIGVSGGLDSTLALLVLCKTMDRLGITRHSIKAFSLPGFGTTSRTRGNALAIMKQLGVSATEIDIRQLCLDEMRALGHKPFGIDLGSLAIGDLMARLERLTDEHRQDVVFENVQARMRTSLLMNAGFVVGTSDVSELALGWCTYNADHMSMYNPNVSIPKTLVKFLVRWAADNEFEGEVRQTLLDIVATEISPELLPAGADGKCAQSTEKAIGPYELHDFFLYYFLRFGFSPEKILYLARHARFDRAYSNAELHGWLAVFVRRFFANQFKRSCLPDGPKVGSISLSPRGDWRMPSDAQAALWLQWLKTSPE
jgi:NAD+ synthase (glutamine-hydrolysing)